MKQSSNKPVVPGSKLEKKFVVKSDYEVVVASILLLRMFHLEAVVHLLHFDTTK